MIDTYKMRQRLIQNPARGTGANDVGLAKEEIPLGEAFHGPKEHYDLKAWDETYFLGPAEN